MECPIELRNLILELIGLGFRNIRVLGIQGKSKLCHLEADHLHNLPNLLINFAPGKLAYYWNVEKAIYEENCDPDSKAAFRQAWTKIKPFVDKYNV